MTYLERTESRARLLDAVAAGRVTLDRTTATWHVDGERVQGWDQRTLVELWQQGGHVQPLDPTEEALASGSPDRNHGAVALTRLGKSTHAAWAPGASAPS